jgi:hypothetical protein
MIDDDGNVLKRITTGSDSWCFVYVAGTKCQSVTWLSPKKPKAQKVRMQKSWVRTMATAFLEDKSIIHNECMQECRLQTVNYINRRLRD